MEARPSPGGVRGPPARAPAPSLPPTKRPPTWPIAAAVVAVVMLVVAVAYLGHGQEGRFYQYDYYVEVTNVTGAFCVTVPVPVLPNGTGFPQLGFDKEMVEGHRLVATEHGLGLEVRGAERTLVSVKGTYNACLRSTDHVSDGDPRLGMSTLTVIPQPSGVPQVAYVVSDTVGLNVTVRFEAIWGNWVEAPLGGEHVRGGAGYDQGIQGDTVVGWSAHLIDMGQIEVD